MEQYLFIHLRYWQFSCTYYEYSCWANMTSSIPVNILLSPKHCYLLCICTSECVLPLISSDGSCESDSACHSLINITWLGSSTSYNCRWGSLAVDWRTMSAPNRLLSCSLPSNFNFHIKHWHVLMNIITSPNSDQFW